jgi:hypothetical protein
MMTLQGIYGDGAKKMTLPMLITNEEEFGIWHRVQPYKHF